MRLLQRTSQQHRGFSLLELILYVGLFSFLILTIMMFLGLLLTARIKQQTITDVEQQGSRIIRQMTQTIRNADTITAPAAGTSATSLSLDVYTASLDPTVFSLSGNTLMLTEGSAAAISLNSSRVSITNLSIVNASRPGTPGLVRIQFTISRTSASVRNEYTYSKTFYGSASLR